MIRIARQLRNLIDPLIGRCSLVPNGPVLDVRDFDWTRSLRDNWQAIRAEALAATLAGGDSAQPCGRRSVRVWEEGVDVDDKLSDCPTTASVVTAIPGVNRAFFSILPPGSQLPRRRGATKGLLTCHLGLIVPRDGDVRMRIGDRIVRWAEGESLLFDDTYPHEVWNDSSGTQVVLLVQVRRPLSPPGRWLNDLLLRGLRYVRARQGRAARSVGI